MECFFLLQKIIKYIGERYKYVFNAKGSGGKNHDNMSFDNFLFEVAGSGICGDLEKVEQMPMYEFMDVLNYIRFIESLKYKSND